MKITVGLKIQEEMFLEPINIQKMRSIFLKVMEYTGVYRHAFNNFKIPYLGKTSSSL